MSITDPFVLPGDVVLMPIAELPEDMLEKVKYKEGDFAIHASGRPYSIHDY
jgi:hypothetical protein